MRKRRGTGVLQEGGMGEAEKPSHHSVEPSGRYPLGQGCKAVVRSRRAGYERSQFLDLWEAWSRIDQQYVYSSGGGGSLSATS